MICTHQEFVNEKKGLEITRFRKAFSWYFLWKQNLQARILTARFYRNFYDIIKDNNNKTKDKNKKYENTIKINEISQKDENMIF